MSLGLICPNLFYIMSWMFNYFWILPLCMGTVIKLVDTEPTTKFYWSKDNPMFQEYEDGARLSIAAPSNLEIICPYQPDRDPGEVEYYTVRWLPFEAFQECHMPRSGDRLFVNCSQSRISTIRFTQFISTFSGVPGGMDYTIGQKYYISSLSTGTHEGMRNEYAGACESHNMRLTITIVRPETQTTRAPSPSPNTSRTPSSNVTTPRRTTPRVTTPSRPTNSRSPTARPTPSTTKSTTRKVITPDIPDPTEIIINVPDNGNTGVITANAANVLTCNPAWVLIISLSLSLFHILNLQQEHYIQR